ncbi:hypothetical protein CHARACLAT_032638 [Characodon lateralis]|uniref:Uncharacterized protein n=1 Tax=Characodon lateralis TaxID=208331 RepID=A0ABU7EZV3_9TELE|nr:hypothetical protein [Characodon lateralis]
MEPAVWWSANAADLMYVGDPEPSHLTNFATLWKVKQERNDLELGDKDPILSLQVLKYSTPHSGSNADIRLHTFFCHHWSHTQLHLYKTLSRKCTPNGSIKYT